MRPGENGCRDADVLGLKEWRAAVGEEGGGDVASVGARDRYGRAL